MDLVCILILLFVLIVSYVYLIIFYFKNRTKIENNDNGNIVSEKNRLCGIFYNEKGEVDHIAIKGKADIRIGFSDNGRINWLESSNGKNKSLYYDDEGRLEKEGFRANHEKVGEWIHYRYENGMLIDSYNKYENGIERNMRFYHDYDINHLKKDFIYDKEGFLEEEREYNYNGNLVKEIVYSDQKKIETEFDGDKKIVKKYKCLNVYPELKKRIYDGKEM